tara:strand:+ start:1524 stop:2504 length:981 start_codon:yes stop_codon:yes gene_type:complete
MLAVIRQKTRAVVLKHRANLRLAERLQQQRRTCTCTPITTTFRAGPIGLIDRTLLDAQRSDLSVRVREARAAALVARALRRGGRHPEGAAGVRRGVARREGRALGLRVAPREALHQHRVRELVEADDGTPLRQSSFHCAWAKPTAWQVNDVALEERVLTLEEAHVLRCVAEEMVVVHDGTIVVTKRLGADGEEEDRVDVVRIEEEGTTTARDGPRVEPDAVQEEALHMHRSCFIAHLLSKARREEGAHRGGRAVALLGQRVSLRGGRSDGASERCHRSRCVAKVTARLRELNRDLRSAYPARRRTANKRGNGSLEEARRLFAAPEG